MKSNSWWFAMRMFSAYRTVRSVCLCVSKIFVIQTLRIRVDIYCIWCCIIFFVKQTEKNGQTFEMVIKCPFLLSEGFISIGIWSLSSILGVNWLIYWQILYPFTLSLKLVSKQTLTIDFILIPLKTPLHLNISKLTDRS